MPTSPNSDNARKLSLISSDPAATENDIRWMGILKKALPKLSPKQQRTLDSIYDRLNDEVTP